MATHEATIHPFPAQGRTTSVSRQVCGGRCRSKAPVLELPKRPTYPSWVLQVARLTSTELSVLVDVARRDGVDEAKSSPSGLKLLKLLEQRSLLEFHERVNLWRLTGFGETIVEMAEKAGSDIQLRPARMARVLQFPSA